MQLFGGGNSAAKDQLEQQQRRNLADLARQQAEVDQASASTVKPGRRSGRGLLTFLSGDGQGTLG